MTRTRRPVQPLVLLVILRRHWRVMLKMALPRAPRGPRGTAAPDVHAHRARPRLVHPRPSLAEGIAVHDAAAPSCAASIAFDRGARLGIVVLSNAGVNADSISRHLMRHETPLARGAPRGAARCRSPRRYVIGFQSPARCSASSRRDDRLFVKVPYIGALPLRAENEHCFFMHELRFEFEFAFDWDADGRIHAISPAPPRPTNVSVYPAKWAENGAGPARAYVGPAAHGFQLLQPMRMTRSEFLSWPHKAMTSLGMSGVGKTTLAYKLPALEVVSLIDGATIEFGTKYLDEPILDNIKRQAMKVDFLVLFPAQRLDLHRKQHHRAQLELVATFLGPRLTRPAVEWGPSRSSKNATSCTATPRLPRCATSSRSSSKRRRSTATITSSTTAGGSLVELEDERTITDARRTTRSSSISSRTRKPERALVQRAIDDPKPLYYQESFLHASSPNTSPRPESTRPEEIVPDDFVRWIFPALVAHRRPRYEALAEKHGYTLHARLAEGIRGRARLPRCPPRPRSTDAGGRSARRSTAHTQPPPLNTRNRDRPHTRPAGGANAAIRCAPSVRARARRQNP